MTKQQFFRSAHQPQWQQRVVSATLVAVLTVALSLCIAFVNLSREFLLDGSNEGRRFHGFEARNLVSKAHSSSSSLSNCSDLDALLRTKNKRAASYQEVESGPYHNWGLFSAEFDEMMQNLKIYVYPDVFMSRSNSSPFAQIFHPHPDPFLPRLGNYFSEHMFKVALLHSSLLTYDPEEADLFFLPFSINRMRNDPRVHSEAFISEFVAQYTTKIIHNYRFWNTTAGSDHFYVYCHSVGREAASKHHHLRNNAIQVTCSSSYFQRYYISHKDVALPQIWPRSPEKALNPPDARHRLVYFAGRIQNSRIRQALSALWENETDMDIFSKTPDFTYQEGFRRSKYCLHVRGYEVNTARISDAMHYGCIPVIISNYYELPFVNVLNWSKFSVIIRHEEIAFLKRILLSISRPLYLKMYHNLCQVRQHFVWHKTPKSYDAFHMTAYQLWQRRSMKMFSY